MTTQDWMQHVEKRLQELERLASLEIGKTAEEIELDRVIRDAFRSWLAFGRATRWLIFLLATSAGAITAWELIWTRIKAAIFGD